AALHRVDALQARRGRAHPGLGVVRVRRRRQDHGHLGALRLPARPRQAGERAGGLPVRGARVPRRGARARPPARGSARAQPRRRGRGVTPDLSPLDPETRRLLAETSAATLATVLFVHGLKNQVPTGVRRLRPGGPRMVGVARTLRYIAARDDLETLEL